MTAGWKHVVKRRVHLERAQPAARQKLGLLEKRADYLQRARDFHRKERRLNKLVERARLHNPDEYHRDMCKYQKDEGGILRKRPEAPDEAEVLKVNGNDRKIVEYKAAIAAKFAEKAKMTLHDVSAPRAAQQTFFVESDSEARDLVDELADDDCDDQTRLLRELALAGVAAAGGDEGAADAAREIVEATSAQYQAVAAARAEAHKLHEVVDRLELAKNRAEGKRNKQQWTKIRSKSGKDFLLFKPKRQR